VRLDPTLEAARENLALVQIDIERAASTEASARSSAIFPGFAIEDATWARDGRRAARIVEIAPSGAAAVAGLRPGDLILRANGAAVSSAATVDAMMRRASPGSAIRLDLVRGDAPFSVELRP
jgi:S1-C subfamily serine protease